MALAEAAQLSLICEVLTTDATAEAGAAGARLLITFNIRVAVPLPLALVAVKVTSLCPKAVGVPEIIPVAASKLRPAGKPVALYEDGVALALMV